MYELEGQVRNRRVLTPSAKQVQPQRPALSSNPAALSFLGFRLEISCHEIGCFALIASYLSGIRELTVPPSFFFSTYELSYRDWNLDWNLEEVSKVTTKD
jgi:hypothetical protein